MPIDVPTNEEFKELSSKVTQLGSEIDAIRDYLEQEVEVPVIPEVPTEPKPEVPTTFLSKLATSNGHVIELEPSPNGKRYGATHPALGFGNDSELRFVNNHGGFTFDVDTGKLIEASGFHGGFMARQWSDTEPDFMYGVDNGMVLRRRVGGKPSVVINLSDIKDAFPSLNIKEFYAGVFEGRFVRKGIIYITGRSDSMGYLLKFDISTGKFAEAIPILTFNWRAGRPDFGSSGILKDRFFYKAVLQNTNNTQTPWILVDDENIYKSDDKRLFHSGAYVHDMTDAIITIGGQVTRLDDGELLTTISSMANNNLDYHVGCLDGIGQNHFIFDTPSGKAIIMNGKGDSFVATTNTSGRKVDYVSGGAIEGKTCVTYVAPNNKMYVQHYTD